MGKPTVCLINPPSLFMIDDRVFPSLGILMLAAVMKALGFRVEFLDLSGLEDNVFEDVLRRHVATSPATIYGLTATTPQILSAAKMAAIIKEVKPGVRTVIGGPHMTLVNAAAKLETKRGIAGRARDAMSVMEGAFDVLVAGNGELAIETFCSDNPPKLIDADDPSSSLWLGKDELRVQPWPARDLIDTSTYHYQIEGVATTTVMAQLGCPFGCTFCGGRLSPMLRRVRQRDPLDVVEEMIHLSRDHGWNGFMFVDDELNLPPQENILGLMEGIERAQRDLGVTWKLRGLNKASLFDKEQAVAMYRAGFRELLFGFESGSPRILRNMLKGNVEENTRAVEICREAGLKVKALMSIGHAGESLESIEETRAWLKLVRPDSLDMSVITCYPGTPYFDEAVETRDGVYTYTAKNGDRLHQVEVDFTQVDGYAYKMATDSYRSYVFTDQLTQDDVVRWRDDLDRDVRRYCGIPEPGSLGHDQPSVVRGVNIPPGPLPESILRVSASA